MQRMNWKNFIALAGMLMVSACSTVTRPPQHAAPSLFTLEPTPERMTLQKTAQGNLATLLNDPANAELTLINMDPALIARGPENIVVSMPNGKSVQFEHDKRLSRKIAGFDGWVGYKRSEWKLRHPSAAAEIDVDPLYYLSLVRDGNTVVGQLTFEGQPYRIDTIGAGKYVLVSLDETKLPLEAEPLLGSTEVTSAPAPASPESNHSTIRVLMVSTIEARAANPNYEVAMAQALQDANAYMLNSGVAISYELTGYIDADYAETGKNSQLEDLRDTSGPLGSFVALFRDLFRADLVTLYSTTRNYCGRAYVDSTKATGFSVVACLSSMGHELGHNLGARHNWEPGNSQGNPPYMYGYRYTGGPRFRTQMSYDCSGGSCPRIPYHSTPRLTYQGIAMGTGEHHDVARRFNERRETVENFYPTELIFTLYEHENYEGESCTIVHARPKSDHIYSGCGAGWEGKVSSAKISGMVPGMSFSLLSSSHNGVTYTIKSSISGIGLPQLKSLISYSPWASAEWRGGSLNDQVFYINSSGF